MITPLGSGSTVYSSCYTRARAESVGSGLDTKFFSGPNSDDDVFVDQPAMAAASVAPPAAVSRASPEDFSPDTSAVVHWVHHQSTHDQALNTATTTQRAQMTTPPPHNGQSRALHDDQDQSGNRVYEIATLLKLRETQCAVPVMLRVKPEAIAENIFQYMGANRAHRIPTRSRGLSDISNFSRGNISHNDSASYSKDGSNSYGHARRQPNAPPQNSMLRQHDGFARFLKQHASPPHHRVTAGGRIVPAGPSSPPPTLDFSSLNGIVRDPPATARLSHREGHKNPSNLGVQRIKPQPITPLTSGVFSSIQGYTTSDQSLVTNQLPATSPYNNVTSGYQPLVSPMPQTTAATVPMAMFPDGSTLVSYSGIGFRAYWNGVNMIMEPLQALPLAVDQQFYSQGNVQAQANDALFDGAQSSHDSNRSLPMKSSSNHSKAVSAAQAAGTDEEGLKIQLANVDKYLALYHYEVTPAERVAYVTQRRYLVEEIDKIRVRKEQPKRIIPIIEPVTGAHIVPHVQNVPKSQPKTMTASGVHRAIQKVELNNKGLSPAAPAFIPRNQQGGPTASSKFPAAKQQSKQSARLEVPEPRLKNLAPFNLQDVANAAISRKDKALHTYEPDTKNTSHRHASSSSVLDPSDPAMRVIDYEDIEYAGRYLYNWTKATKTYCTTVAEFQEAIRRVREQARMYGCEGGQSKDPAYDAEQDIWWAICDRDPIPLPSKVPDHVANPRPWNWNDSAFNYRREGSPWPGPECDKARNSPRLAGWDPVITEAMKDRMDVSRSYFALKGQLPSVPFRDFAYDRHGNKVKIQSETDPDLPGVDSSCDRNEKKASNKTEGISVTQHAPLADTNALRDMSTNDLNGRRIAPIITPKNKPSRKKHFTDGDAIKPSFKSVIANSQQKPTQAAAKASPALSDIAPASKIRALDSHLTTVPQDRQPGHRSHQSYVEEYPETPTARRTRADSRGSPTSQIHELRKTSTTLQGLDAGERKDQSITASNTTTNEEHVPYSVSNWIGKPIDVNDPWYGPPTDPVTLDYLARLKTWCPGDPDVLETIAAEQKKCAEENTTMASQEPFRGPSYGIGSPKSSSSERQNRAISRTNVAGSPKCSYSPSSEIRWNTQGSSAETRSPWGPEQNSPFFDSSQRSRQANSVSPTHSIQGGKAAKVNIPNATYKGVLFTGENPLQALHVGNAGHSGHKAHGINPVKADSLPINNPHHFLRKMLKSPTFSTAQAFKVPTRPSSKLANDYNSEATRIADMKDPAPNGGASLGFVGSYKPASSASVLKSAPNTSLSKAQSSLASSPYQAQGYLPQFGGAGKAHAASLYGGHGGRSDQALPSPVRVSLPSYTSYEDKQTTFAPPSYHTYQGADVHNIPTNHHTPVNFGFDGGADSPPAKKGIANSSNDPKFDYKGVTVADYEIQRPDPDSAWHQGEVEDFFQELAKVEETEILSHRRGNTQSAA